MRNEILRSKKPQVYAQRLVGTHKKLQQADTEPFQVRVVCACKKKLLHQRSSLRSDACSNHISCVESDQEAIAGCSIHPRGAGKWELCS